MAPEPVLAFVIGHCHGTVLALEFKTAVGTPEKMGEAAAVKEEDGLLFFCNGGFHFFLEPSGNEAFFCVLGKIQHNPQGISALC